MRDFFTDPEIGSEDGIIASEINENIEINDPSTISELNENENFNNFIEVY